MEVVAAVAVVAAVLVVVALVAAVAEVSWIWCLVDFNLTFSFRWCYPWWWCPRSWTWRRWPRWWP